MGLISLLFKDPLMFFMVAVPLLYSIIAHEIAHGWVAYLFGDDTAERAGRLSLNPLDHLDPVGTIALFIVGFGWAKPVPVNFARLRPFRAGVICVSLAGCLTNIVIATIALFLLQFRAVAGIQSIAVVLVVVAKINIILGSLNLIPIPPLDGSKILMGILPREAQMSLARLEPYGFYILIFLLFTGMLNPVIMFMQAVLLTLIGAVL